MLGTPGSLGTLSVTMIETFTDGLPSSVHHLAGRVMTEACGRGLTLAVAESCTGGLAAAVMTDVEGCSRAFDRGFVCYTDAAKREVLGLDSEMLARLTAVSPQAAAAMATGALARSDADFALSVTGFAGPGAPGEEPGLVYLAVARRHHGVGVIRRRYGKVSRAQVRIACLEDGFRLLLAAMTTNGNPAALDDL